MFDERYKEEIKEVKDIWSEFSFYKECVLVETEYLISFCKVVDKKLTAEEEKIIKNIYKNFSEKDLEKIKEIESRIKHDIKSVEYFIKEFLPDYLKSFVHIGITSEDIKNIVWRILLKKFLKEVYIPQLVKLVNILLEFAEKYKSLPILSRTHAQPASPTTLGKIFVYFAYRLAKNLEKISKSKLYGKLNGSVGDFHELNVIYPNIDWVEFSCNFVKKFGLEPIIITTQIAPYDDVVNILRIISSINQIVLDLNNHCWLYIRDNYFVQKFEKEQVGSSVMPHKVNPIDFENSMGNISIANSLIIAANALQVSEDQRKIHDSAIMRSMDRIFSSSILAYKRTIKNLEVIEPNVEKILEDIRNHPEVITAAIQTILRKFGVKDAYEKLKSFSQGKKLTLDEIYKFVENLNIPEEAKNSIFKLKPEKYVGLAEKLTEYGIEECRKLLENL
jgi:adenylosuccinate lyase